MRLRENINFLASKKGLTADELLTQIGVQTSIDFLTPTELIKIANTYDLSLDLLLRHNINFSDRAAQADIKLLILDIDGVMTDGGMYFTENGDQIKKYNAKDGMAIIHLTKNNFQVGVISSGFTDNMIRQRVELLKIPRFHVGRDSKYKVLSQWMKELDISIDNVAYIGDDINDLEIMEQCGLAVCPNDAVPAILEIADIILSKNGGDGCVREFIDQYLIPNIDLGKVRY